MASLHSFYLPENQWHSPFILEGQEAHHLGKVLRIKTGTTVRLFDGKGRFGLFVVEKVAKNVTELSLKEEYFLPEPKIRHTIAAGYSKALRRGWFLEKAVELEAHGLILWQGDHSQSSLPEKEKATWAASLVSGAKQCGNPYLPLLSMMPEGVEGLAHIREQYTKAYLLYEGDTKGRILQKEELSYEGETLMVVGPEGGFSSREVGLLLDAGFTPVSLGDRVLRWETAAILTLGLAWWAKQ